MQRNVELEATIVAKYAAVSPVLDERSRRRWAAAESVAIGYGGDALVSSATRGTPLTTYETIVDRIGSTRTETGLWVRAELNAGRYPTGVTVTKEEMDAIALVRDGFHGEWNYKLLPR